MSRSAFATSTLSRRAAASAGRHTSRPKDNPPSATARARKLSQRTRLSNIGGISSIGSAASRGGINEAVSGGTPTPNGTLPWGTCPPPAAPAPPPPRVNPARKFVEREPQHFGCGRIDCARSRVDQRVLAVEELHAG